VVWCISSRLICFFLFGYNGNNSEESCWEDVALRYPFRFSLNTRARPNSEAAYTVVRSKVQKGSARGEENTRYNRSVVESWRSLLSLNVISPKIKPENQTQN